MAKNDGQLDGKLTLPNMNIRSADAGHLGADERGAGFQVLRESEFPQLEVAFKFLEDRRFPNHAAPRIINADRARTLFF
jgi:hypothetical protein